MFSFVIYEFSSKNGEIQNTEGWPNFVRASSRCICQVKTQQSYVSSCCNVF